MWGGSVFGGQFVVGSGVLLLKFELRTYCGGSFGGKRCECGECVSRREIGRVLNWSRANLWEVPKWWGGKVGTSLGGTQR